MQIFEKLIESNRLSRQTQQRLQQHDASIPLFLNECIANRFDVTTKEEFIDSQGPLDLEPAEDQIGDVDTDNGNYENEIRLCCRRDIHDWIDYRNTSPLSSRSLYSHLSRPPALYFCTCPSHWYDILPAASNHRFSHSPRKLS